MVSQAGTMVLGQQASWLIIPVIIHGANPCCHPIPTTSRIFRKQREPQVIIMHLQKMHGRYIKALPTIIKMHLIISPREGTVEREHRIWVGVD